MKKTKFLLTPSKSVISNKMKEAFTSVIPVFIIVLVLLFSFSPVDSGTLLVFVVGAIFTVLGIGLFTLGADTAMTPIGEFIGTSTIKTRKLWIIIPVFFIVGVMITVSEPDLTVLATQLSSVINNWVLIISVGVGVGLFLVIAFLRILLKIKLKYILIGCYVLIFILAFIIPETFLPLSFDAGGVTTGPMSVPFIIAIGTGTAYIRSDKNADSDGFGLTALCSIGPILSVMILGLIFKPEEFATSSYDIQKIVDSTDLLKFFALSFPQYLKEVAIALCPIVVFFFLYRIFGFKMAKIQFIKIIVGILYTYVGLVLFLVGVNAGFLPVGYIIGKTIGSLSYNYIMIPIGMIIGFFVVMAEPAVHVLTKQVYEITSGNIPEKALRFCLMIGVAVSCGLAMAKIIFGIPIVWILLCGYLLAIVLSFFGSDTFTAVAFDAGGVASGAMTSSFLLPLAIGLCEAVEGNIATEGFGVVALVAMTPLITIQLLGIYYNVKLKAIKRKQSKLSKKEEKILE